MTTPSMMTELKSTQMQSGPAREGHGLDEALLESMRRDFESRPANRLAANAVTQAGVDEVALNRDVVTTTDHTFSHKLDAWAVTNQKKTGRCWMFAALNLFRVGAMKKMNLKEFEFSQNYTLFWDKLERANFFFEAILQTADRPLDDRHVAFLLDRPLDDGGQWNMFINLVTKHGLVPKAMMPETESSSNTARLNSVLLNKLREGAMTLRALRADGAPMEAAQAGKRELISVIHRILCIHLGTPPTSFTWQWNDKDDDFHRDGEMTPQQFASKYVDLPIEDYVCIVNDPREAHPYNQTYTVEFLGNVVGGKPVVYLNVDMATMKSIAQKTIVDGEPVWFGCDVGKMMRRDLGLWDKDLFEYGAVYDTTFTMTKADRLEHHGTLMTHAMLFTGV
ncbi:MAG: C1 family peptidase, partial [Planctomycetota bacterium]|nr:C1 family peptidase [Planctomycetota bacterium]